MRISDWSSDVGSSDLGGYVVEFSNGLTVYLSGDTGHTAEQDTVVWRRFGAEPVVMNIGGIFSTGPAEAAVVIDELVKPASVLASHAKEIGKEHNATPDTNAQSVCQQSAANKKNTEDE